MDNQNQNYMSGQNQMSNNQPQNGGVPPVPPPPSVKVRTMDSDYKSMNESGGQPPVPEKVIVPPTDPNVKFSNFNAPSQEPTFKPAQKSSSVQPSVPLTNIAKKKSPVVLIIIFLVIIALGVGGYFGYSYFFAQPSQPAAAPASFPATSLPAPAVVPTSTSAPATTTIPALIHKSFFKIPASQNIQVSFSLADGILGLKTALVTAIPSNATSGIYEVALSDKSGNALSASDVLPIITSSMSSSSITAGFQPDFTLFLYKDNQGVWPGYILSANSTSSMSAAQALAVKLESTTDLANFYLADPGSFGVFKDGKLGTYSTRYAVSANKDALNYGFFGNYLIISDSYNGLKAAVANLGL